MCKHLIKIFEKMYTNGSKNYLKTRYGGHDVYKKM